MLPALSMTSSGSTTSTGALAEASRPEPNCTSTLLVSASPFRLAMSSTSVATTCTTIWLSSVLLLPAGALTTWPKSKTTVRSEEHTSELQSRGHLVCRLLLEKKKKIKKQEHTATLHRQTI